MNFEQWISPETYNLTSEMENHPSDRIALRWLSDQNELEEITYGELFKQANRLAGACVIWAWKRVIGYWSWYHAVSLPMSFISLV